ncbi:hypothetical protein Tco_0010023 [Tanacetum coccineum]
MGCRAEPIDGDNLSEVFGPDKRERPADVNVDAAERAYEAQRGKDLAIKKFEENEVSLGSILRTWPH